MPATRRLVGGLEVRLDQYRRRVVAELLAVKPQIKYALAQEDAVDARQMLLDLAARPGLELVVGIEQRNFGEVRLFRHRRFSDVQFLDVVTHDRSDVEGDRPLHRLAECGRPDFPAWREPGCGAFHAHAEFGQARRFRRQFSRSECPRVFAAGDAGSVITNLDPEFVGPVELDLNFEAEAVPVQPSQSCPVPRVTLQ